MTILPQLIFGQSGKRAVNGQIKDSESGEFLAGATIFISKTSSGTVSNEYGYYTLNLPVGKNHIRYSYIGYNDSNLIVQINSDTTINVELKPLSEQLQEIEIKVQSARENITSTQMSVNKLTAATIKNIPAFMGEVDLVKALQLLPGVKFVAEGSSGFSVRGGSPDQNLVMLDEATVYNAGHLMGFFSVFNSDAVKSVTLYKGDIPAAYGGRLSSLVDVRMKEGNSKQFHGQGGVGLIAARLLFEGPIIKNKVSFMVSGRRTYADLFLKLSSDANINRNQLYFYDLNTKLNYSINENNHIFFSGYFGKDVFKNNFFQMNWGNATGTFRWNHLFSKKIFSNFTFVVNRFNYNLGLAETNPRAFMWQSSLTDYNLKGDFAWLLNSNNKIKFGFSSIYHNFFPGKITGIGTQAVISEYALDNNYALESGIYMSDEQNVGARFTLRYGLRFSLFNNIGPGISFHFNTYGNVTDSTVFGKNKFFNTYWGLEPRLGILYQLNENSSLKVSYTRIFQYIQQAQNSSAGNPLDIWFPASPNVKPQIGDQIALGYFRNFKKDMFETSVELYYKTIENAVDFKDHADLLLNKYLEGELRFGKGYGYGLELMVRKNGNKISGWISYTYSRTFRQIKDINNGIPYPATYDRPNDFSLVMNYHLNTQISFGLNWVFLSGQPVTFPVGRMGIGNTIVPIYSGRNEYRLPDYHRLDLSFTWSEKQKAKRKWHSEINFSIYNAYNRKNPWVINFKTDPNKPNLTYAEMTYILGFLPAITYNFKF